jgi:hypothetical protein
MNMTKHHKIKIGVVYALHDTTDRRQNLDLYLQHSLQHNEITHVIVVNGPLNTPLPSSPNLHVITRPNEGYDFGGFSDGLEYLLTHNPSCDYFFFLNGSCRGPFLPPYYKEPWYTPLCDLFVGNIHMVGATINSMNRDARLTHVQSYFWAITKECAVALNEAPFFKTIRHDKDEVIQKQEIGLSMWLKYERGWNMSCLIPEYQGIDYISLKTPVNPYAAQHGGDICSPGKTCFGRDVHPYEAVFIKVNDWIPSEAARSLTRFISS